MQFLRTLGALFFIILLIAAGLVTQAGAQEEGAMHEAAAGSSAPIHAYNYRMAGDQQRMRIILHFDRKPEVNWFLLRAPHRLVVDLPETEFAIDETRTEPRGLVTRVRYGRMREGHSRMIVTLVGPFVLDELSVLQNETSAGYRLIVDLVSASEEAFEAAMRERIDSAPGAGSAAKRRRIEADDERFTVAIDAGHGGIDSGARGAGGTQEKTITLAFALELKNKMEETGRYNVVMTRESDVFLRLDERVRIARENGADLLLSIHADSIRIKDFGGATVYTLSDKASDPEAAATAARENLSDSLAGLAEKDDQDEVTDILADLIRRETHAFSIRFARTLVGKLTDTVNFVNNPMRSAGFRVLRAPDVPSVLLELGYLSNPEEEEQLRDADWRERAARNIVEAIAVFAEAKRAAGG
ncbi:N-acetylmuramoyl-L-alanine amidase [Nitratireductor sp. GCM10026969]|uniref:N-acetylmuramoyl-L-alanine amidase n=1 Tax=Nitratireductor sp. GCM10026969 TaxID=3252645 RepID=UPI00360768AD